MTYKWDKLSKHQQDAARRLAFGKLKDIAGATTSQCAKYLDEAMDYDRGSITLDELLAVTGWAR